MSEPDLRGIATALIPRNEEVLRSGRGESHQAGPRHRAPGASASPSAVRGQNFFDVDLLFAAEYRDRRFEDIHGLLRVGVMGSRRLRVRTTRQSPTARRSARAGSSIRRSSHRSYVIIRPSCGTGEDGAVKAMAEILARSRQTLLPTPAAAGITRRHGQDRHSLGRSALPRNRCSRHCARLHRCRLR